MIIRHQGRTMAGDEIISGYAVCEGDKIYIYLEDGQKKQVKRSSVVPVLTDLKKGNTAHSESAYGHPLSCLEVSDYILTNLRARGVVCLEDFEKWSYEDFMRVRGLGKLRTGKILEKLEGLGIETQAAVK